MNEALIRLMEEQAKVLLSWPSRVVHAWGLLFPMSVAALFLVSRFSERVVGVLGGALLIGFGAVLIAWQVVTNRAHEKARAGTPTPEPGGSHQRAFRLGGIGLGGLAIAMGAHHTTFASSMVSGRNRALANAAAGVFEPDPAFTTVDHPALVRWARATRALWRNTWIAYAPTRWVVNLLAGWIEAFWAQLFWRRDAVKVLAHHLGGTVTPKSEAALLDWLDRQEWGPAPHVPHVWLGARYTVCGSRRGAPVAVSVVRRFAYSSDSDVSELEAERTDVFVSARRTMSQGAAADLRERAAALYYYVSFTPWGAVFYRDDADSPGLTPEVVSELIDAFLTMSEPSP